MESTRHELPKHDLHSAHAGRHGGNALNPKHAAHIGRQLLADLVAGRIVITNAEPAFDTSDAAGTLSREMHAIEHGEVELTKLEGFPVAEAGEHRVDGVRVTWKNPDGSTGSRRVDWRLA